MQISASFRLDNKVAIITGASKGIGRAIAMSLGQQGATVIVVSSKQDAVDETAASFRQVGINATGIACHMGDLEQIQQWLTKNNDMAGWILSSIMRRSTRYLVRLFIPTCLFSIRSWT